MGGNDLGSSVTSIKMNEREYEYRRFEPFLTGFHIPGSRRDLQSVSSCSRSMKSSDDHPPMTLTATAIADQICFGRCRRSLN